MLLRFVNADLLFVFAQSLELHDAVGQSEQSIVFTDTDVVAGMEFGASLADENISRKHGLAVRTLYAETFCLAVSAVVRGARSLFMSK